MTCQELERLLYPYLDGEFQPEERVDLESHLSACAGCQRRVEEERNMQLALRRAARHSVQRMQAPASLRAGIAQGLHQEHRRAQYGVWLRAGAVALVVVTVTSGWSAYQAGKRERLAKEELVLRFKRPLPYEVTASNSEQLETWFKGTVDPRVALPQLPRAKPLGGRISILNGREVAYISYETLPDEGGPSRRLGVFVVPDESSPRPQALPAVEVDSAQGFNIVTWRDHEVVYEMVTDMDERDILRMLEEREHGAALASTPRAMESADGNYSYQTLPMPARSRPAVSVEPASFP
ncbi:zf-HC2 domain-containing protein [Myxococcus sp. MISCRS1]|uniref:anti-sigma factor family protein n=1 Tax=unclassified Myxococcus TaxID=2648731 RepID=UPI001CBE1BBD|nr:MULTISPECIES: zf-HC2 domain-containing protein [unclassified Myxococcus]MBZ4399507.1 zf-HC2 domain-containing protein [Myxococcus sp. AS-1-15]MCY0995717.1 zf-HC2 domain-containing protein [Myxococcus sp. MISCRS1]